MLQQYLQAAMHRATYEMIEDDHTFYGRIPECQGVWANENTLEECRDELESVLEDWILYRVSKGLALPVIAGVELEISETEEVVA